MDVEVAPLAVAEHFCPSFHGTSRRNTTSTHRPRYHNTHEPPATFINTYDGSHDAVGWYATGRNLTMRF
jgi:hypothetical protein